AELSTLSLHDALPILNMTTPARAEPRNSCSTLRTAAPRALVGPVAFRPRTASAPAARSAAAPTSVSLATRVEQWKTCNRAWRVRSEEHTSELQSRGHL